MASYRIIDEPKVKLAHRFIVNPTAILLSAIFIPIVFHNIPLYGKFWLPFLWLIVNSYLLGSPSFWRECLYTLLGLCSIAGAFLAFGYCIKSDLISAPNSAAPYLRVIVNGIYFSALYLVVFTQTVPFSIYDYVKQQNQHG